MGRLTYSGKALGLTSNPRVEKSSQLILQIFIFINMIQNIKLTHFRKKYIDYIVLNVKYPAKHAFLKCE